jgi:glycosyltransferase involved in cell wall biosynthesis
MPKYSVILPVRNGANHVKECVNSILSQSYGDFELLILENASTDDTISIIESFGDKRVKILPAVNPLSMEENWGRIRAVDKMEFITLIGHDDVLNPDYLQFMDKLIANHPGASLYQGHFRYIDSSGNETGKCQPMIEKQDPPLAVHNFLCNKIDLMGTGFMMRGRDYDLAGGIPNYPNLLFADMELWIEMVRKGYLAVESRELFSYRRHSSATTSTSSDSKFLAAFRLLVDYLVQLKDNDSQLAPVIRVDGACLLKDYCQGITHKILRTRSKDRQTPGVNAVIAEFRKFGERLGVTDFEPLEYSRIKLGKIIDDNPVLHSLFLLFKKIHRKPIL